MDDLILVGGGGHCRAVIDVVERMGRHRIAGIVDGGLERGSKMCGYPVVGGDDDLAALRRDVGNAIVTVGQIRSPAVRIRLFDRLEVLSFTLPTIVSPIAEVSRRAALGRGTVVMHLAAVGPEATIGANCIINTRALVEHDCRVGDHCHVSTGAILNGGVTLGTGSFVASGSVLRDGIEIGASSFVGMGARVTRSLGEGSVYKGEPA